MRFRRRGGAGRRRFGRRRVFKSRRRFKAARVRPMRIGYRF